MTPVIKNEASRICFGLLESARSHDCFMYVRCLLQWGFSFRCGLCPGHSALQIFSTYTGILQIKVSQPESSWANALVCCRDCEKHLQAAGQTSTPGEGQRSPTAKSRPRILSVAPLEIPARATGRWAADASGPGWGVSAINARVRHFSHKHWLRGSQDRPLLLLTVI